MNGSMERRTAVVTGATDGIGLVTARELARRGARLVLPVRNIERGERAMASIRDDTGSDRIEIAPLDLGQMDSVRECAAWILEACERLDVLVNNAGCFNGKRWTTTEGFEGTLAVNHLGPYLLTRMLMERLCADGGARVVFTSSVMHKHSAIDFADLSLERRWSSYRAYGRSKLMNLLTARELHLRFGAQGVVASSVHPGGVRTGIWKKSGLLGKLVDRTAGLWMISAEQGADTLLWLASSPDAAAPVGNYFYQRKPRRTAPFATDEAAKRLWQVSADLVGLEP